MADPEIEPDSPDSVPRALEEFMERGFERVNRHSGEDREAEERVERALEELATARVSLGRGLFHNTVRRVALRLHREAQIGELEWVCSEPNWVDGMDIKERARIRLASLRAQEGE